MEEYTNNQFSTQKRFLQKITCLTWILQLRKYFDICSSFDRIKRNSVTFNHVSISKFDAFKCSSLCLNDVDFIKSINCYICCLLRQSNRRQEPMSGLRRWSRSSISWLYVWNTFSMRQGQCFDASQLWYFLLRKYR